MSLQFSAISFFLLSSASASLSSEIDVSSRPQLRSNGLFGQSRYLQSKGGSGKLTSPPTPAPQEEGPSPSPSQAAPSQEPFDAPTKAPTTSTVPVGDLNVRFNKIDFPNMALPGFMPLQATDYPLSAATASSIQQNALAVSIVTDRDPEMPPNADVNGYIVNTLGGYPTFPNSDENHPFWNELREVVHIQEMRRNGSPSTDAIARLPDLWRGMNIAQVAEAVHDEYPGHWQAKLMQTLWREKAPLDYTVVPFRSTYDFIGTQVRMADLNTWAVAVVSPINFCVKWYAGRPRPEEVAYQIAQGNLTTGVPADIVASIQAMNLGSPESFTAYPEGCPRHPSWPAMHSAASSSSLWLAVLLDLTDAQYCEALRVDYAVSFARTVAGVHYASDNIAGLNLGQAVMADQLADHFASKYGSDRSVVQAKIDSLLFDWATFDPVTCSRTLKN